MTALHVIFGVGLCWVVAEAAWRVTCWLNQRVAYPPDRAIDLNIGRTIDRIEDQRARAEELVRHRARLAAQIRGSRPEGREERRARLLAEEGL